MKAGRRAWGVLALLLPLSPLGPVVGCASTNAIYDSTTGELEAVRGDFASVGVVLAGYAEIKLVLPAKGILGGAKRGVAMGAVWPVIIGILTPVPFAAFVGLLFTPVGALGGAIYGAIAAPPRERVERAEKEMDNAVEEHSEPSLGELLLDEVVSAGRAKTSLSFEALRENRSPSLPEPDVVLELQPLRIGLRGGYAINPSCSSFLDVNVRLVKTDGDVLLFEEEFRCSSELRQRFFVWAAENGALFTAEARRFPAEVAEKIVDDFFLVCPIRR